MKCQWLEDCISSASVPVLDRAAFIPGHGFCKQIWLESFGAQAEQLYYIPQVINIWGATSLPRRRRWQPTPVFLPGESQGRWSLVGCRLWGCTESDKTEAT